MGVLYKKTGSFLTIFRRKGGGGLGQSKKSLSEKNWRGKKRRRRGGVSVFWLKVKKTGFFFTPPLSASAESEETADSAKSAKSHRCFVHLWCRFLEPKRRDKWVNRYYLMFEWIIKMFRAGHSLKKSERFRFFWKRFTTPSHCISIICYLSLQSSLSLFSFRCIANLETHKSSLFQHTMLMKEND